MEISILISILHRYLELTVSIRHIARFLKSGIPIYNSDVPDTAGRKTTRRRTQAIAKRFGFHTSVNNFHIILYTSSESSENDGTVQKEL